MQVLKDKEKGRNPFSFLKEKISTRIGESVLAKILVSRVVRIQIDSHKRKCDIHKLNGGEPTDSHRNLYKNLYGFSHPHKKLCNQK